MPAITQHPAIRAGVAAVAVAGVAFLLVFAWQAMTMALGLPPTDTPHHGSVATTATVGAVGMLMVVTSLWALRVRLRAAPANDAVHLAEQQSFVFAVVVDGLRLQAAPPEVQEQVLPDFVDKPFEVSAAVFPDLLPQLLRDGLLPKSSMPKLHVYSCFLDTYATTPEQDLVDLAQSLWFARLRELSGEVLDAIGQERTAPNLNGAHFVRGR